MKVYKGIQSGTLGATVSVNSKYGQVIRSRPRRARKDTLPRQLARAHCASFAQLWCTLTDQQQAGWRALARRTPCKASPQPGAHPHGCQVFVKLNCALASVGLPHLLDAPKRAKLRLSPVKRLHITRRQGRIRLELELSRKPTAHIVVRGSRPCSAGISTRNTYSIIGLLPAPSHGRCDITGLYVKRFGVPPVGTRVFIRTHQLLNGWEDEFKDLHARVPAQ